MSSPERDLVGAVIDRRFRVLGPIGSGGMGVVWRVQHTESLQLFAMKTLTQARGTQVEALGRFLQEARAAAALRTRHVVRIVDAQVGYLHEGAPLPFIVMELLEGQSLEELLTERGRIGAGEVVWVMRQVARALEAAHQQGIVHRDLKPGNIFLSIDEEREPVVKVCDFGVAKLAGEAARTLLDPGSPRTNDDAVFGTPMYMAPEQLRGAGNAVAATDQWALALVVVRALSGRDYFGGAATPTDLLFAIAHDPLREPSTLDPALTRAFDEWFSRCCSRDPALRFASVTAQAEGLEAALGRPQPEPIRPRLSSGDLAAQPTVQAGSVTATPGASFREAQPTSPSSTRARLLGGIAIGVVLAGLSVFVATRGAEDSAAPPVRAPASAAAQGAAPSPSSRGERGAPDASGAPLVGSGPVVLPVPSVASAHAPRDAKSREPRPGARTYGSRAISSAERATSPGRQRPSVQALPPGQPCSRSGECASGICVAEKCL
jgi:serine/threonine-protein kinase